MHMFRKFHSLKLAWLKKVQNFGLRLNSKRHATSKATKVRVVDTDRFRRCCRHQDWRGKHAWLLRQSVDRP